MTERRPTLAAVAARARVSVSTASLAFSGAGPVAEHTRDRVLTAAAELGYAGPDPRARSLRRGRSGIMAVVMEETVLAAFRDPVMIAFLDGITAEISAAGLSLLLVPEVGAGPATIETVTADAAILIACGANVAAAVDIARHRSMPVVALGSCPVPDLPTVYLDDRAASAELARHLERLGHRRVAVVGLPFDRGYDRGPLSPERETAATVQVSTQRLAGVREVFPDVSVWAADGSLVDEGWQAGRSLLGRPGPDGAVRARSAADRPTAVIAQSDLLAAGVIRAAEEMGISVPGELSVVGFDGIRIDTVIPHDLTTMVQPAAEQGRTAAQMALQQLADVEPSDHYFTSVFHPGATTAPPAA